VTVRLRRSAAPALAGAVLIALLLAGCASAPQAERLLAAPPLHLSSLVLSPQVPFIAQDAHQCGPASLAMALTASGIAVDAEQLQAQVYLPARQGSLQPEMMAAARRHGRLAAELPPRLEAVLREVSNGLPVIVLQNLSLPIAPVWHYAVVIGFDLERAEIVLHSGPNAGQRLPLQVFERTWARGGYWAMVATAPSRLPATVAPTDLLAAAAALERVQPAAAFVAYAALTERAPQLANAWFGLGNTAVAADDLAKARAAFERSVQIDPGHADAWNNLAHVLLALRLPGPARAAAQQAVALGGPRLPRYLSTLTEAEQAR
jgi:tetratricopeptide (TPR) repeat protein